MPSPVVASWRAYCGCALFILCLLLLTSPAQADNLQVPSEYATIQAAMDAAEVGDTVLIADGTYTGAGNKNLNFGGKDITVRSASGNPANCILDCEYSGRGFIFDQGETAAAIVDGLTIRHGSVDDNGGGMLIQSSGPTISRCVFLGNRAIYDHGGGVFISGAYPTLINCAFTANSTSFATGGGVYIRFSNVTLINCTFTANSAALSGGALSSSFAEMTCRNCILWGNNAVNTEFNELFNLNDYLGIQRDLYPTKLYTSLVLGFPASPPDANGNIGADPLFVRAPSPGPDNQWGTEDDDYGDLRLRPGSPCINAGDNSALPVGVATDLDGNARIFGNAVDLGAYEFFVRNATPPVITTPGNLTATATSTAGAVVTFNVTAADDEDGPVAVTCSPASGSTFAPGTTTVHCIAYDSEGNIAEADFTVTVTYSWSGVLQPINANGSSVFKAGSTVPVKFALTGASAPIANLSATLTFARLSNGDPGAVNEATSTSAATSGNLFRYDVSGGQYIFNWSTKGLSSGKYRLFINLGDGVTRAVDLGLK